MIVRRHLQLVPDRPTPDPSVTPHRLKLGRELAQLTMVRAARLVGMQPGLLESAEAGVLELDRTQLEQLASWYGCSVDWLLGLVPEKADPSEINEVRDGLSPANRDRLLTILGSAKEVASARY